jgi:hypothetical protein
VEVSCHERHLFASVSQPSEGVEPNLGRSLYHHPIVCAISSPKRSLEFPQVFAVIVNHEQDWI